MIINFIHDFWKNSFMKIVYLFAKLMITIHQVY